MEMFTQPTTNAIVIQTKIVALVRLTKIIQKNASATTQNNVVGKRGLLIKFVPAIQISNAVQEKFIPIKTVNVYLAYIVVRAKLGKIIQIVANVIEMRNAAPFMTILG